MAKVRINFAGVDKLKTLPGIGDAIAPHIVQMRQRSGNISLDDLVQVPHLKITTDLLEALDFEVNPAYLVEGEVGQSEVDDTSNSDNQPSQTPQQIDPVNAMTDRVSDLIISRDMQQGRAKVTVRASTEGKRAPDEQIFEITDQRARISDTATGGTFTKSIDTKPCRPNVKEETQYTLPPPLQ